MVLPILAVDLGLFNSVPAWYRANSGEVRFRAVPTTPEELRRERSGRIARRRSSRRRKCGASWRHLSGAGLGVHAWLDEKGRVVSNEEWAASEIRPSQHHGEWNYEIHPRRYGESMACRSGANPQRLFRTLTS